MSLLQQVGFELAVSSVCEFDEEQFGGHHMLSPADDGYCWNSDKGSPQFISVYFQKPVNVRSARITFQGGYVGQDIDIKIQRAGDQSSEWCLLRERVFVDDTNEEQSILVQEADDSSLITAFQLLFKDSTDMFGRISVYQLTVEGHVS